MQMVATMKGWAAKSYIQATGNPMLDQLCARREKFCLDENNINAILPIIEKEEGVPHST